MYLLTPPHEQDVIQGQFLGGVLQSFPSTPVAISR